MDETILFPSPNWFQVSGLAVSSDGWVVYGGPSKSLCVLEPLPADYDGVVEGNHGYKAHVLSRAHLDKIVSVDISPEWPEKRAVLTGSANGSVKQWNLEQGDGSLKFKSTLSHDIHSHEKEDIVGVAYSNEVYAVTMGAGGNIVKWDLNSNVVKTYNNILKTFKPTSLACSHHVPLNIAIGTKQGVLFVVDLTGPGSILYKVRSQDDEIMNVSWCPQYEIQIEKLLDDTKTSDTSNTQDKATPKKISASDRMEKIRQQRDPEDGNSSGLVKELPEDSFGDFEVVEEDDMFDMYKDHEADEFGHKKFVPEDIVVKIITPEKEIDYLTECMKLKEDILNKKNEPEPTIESLVEKLDKASLNNESSKQESAGCSKEEIVQESKPVSSMHVHKHLLATIGKQGMVRIWSKTGKLVGSCSLSSGVKNPQNRHRAMSWATLTWCKPNLLLLVDGKNQLLECNPLKIDCKNKLHTKVIHSIHKRGLHCVASNAWRKPAPGAPAAWTVAQDRTLARYDIADKKTTVYNTCGGFVYNIQMCPYDATKVAISVGDGAVRVWTAEESETEEGKLSFGRVTSYWQHVQGKVLTVAWHPTKENLLAFGTAEARVGLIDASGGEKPARTLPAGAAGGVYSLSWGAALYVAARGDLLAYCASPDQPPTPIPVVLEGAAWSVSAVRARGALLAVGSDAGGVAVIQHTGGAPLAATFPYTKTIHTIEWHPTQTSLSSEESPHKNLLAVCSQDKANTVVILEYKDNEDGSHDLTTWKTLSGHAGSVLQVAWSPHSEARLLSTAHDGTVRVWDVSAGVCTAIFGGHDGATLAAAWGAQPARPDAVLSGGADCCLRLWSAARHPPSSYVETKPEVPKRDKKKKKDVKDKKQDTTEVAHESEDSDDNAVAATLDSKVKASKRFLLPSLSKEMASKFRLKGAKRMLQKYLVKKGIESAKEEEELNLDFIKMFGSSNEVNEVFEMELKRHLEFGNMEAWVVLNVFRGHIDAMMQVASEKGILCPYLLSIAPSVSAKYWKDASRMYLAQIDRLVANGEEDKLVANRSYGGPVFRKAVTLLSLQDVKAAVTTLCEARLFKEAYLLCRIRYIDTIADEVLLAWAKSAIHSGVPDMAAICYIALGNLLEAATVLGKCKDEDSLGLAAELARAAGQTILSDNIVERRAQIKDQTTELLEQLPSRIELLMKSIQENENCDVKE